METIFDLEMILDDRNSGVIKSAEVTIDPAHNGKPEHIDVHILYENKNGLKLKDLGGVEKLKEQCPWMQTGCTLKL